VFSSPFRILPFQFLLCFCIQESKFKQAIYINQCKVDQEIVYGKFKRDGKLCKVVAAFISLGESIGNNTGVMPVLLGFFFCFAEKTTNPKFKEE